MYQEQAAGKYKGLWIYLRTLKITKTYVFMFIFFVLVPIMASMVQPSHTVGASISSPSVSVSWLIITTTGSLAFITWLS